ncbi:glutamate/aspartate transport system permease protein [Gilliamella bombicola]|uniref:Glutamate/aspartate import permease protein GltK n=1 Tax=Gilliamella bombicola TaxID=1798182 RepID=A0A1C3YVT0_9GAMM|nr:MULTISPECIES: ABC transporter permease subunit [Gilliamella]NUF27509.1 ABC transporter permease subunit [Gilliamella sp. ESL0254]SCB74224.1 glutamate/aspartate transport system permease protein [Gilliamella bombicola]
MYLIDWITNTQLYNWIVNIPPLVSDKNNYPVLIDGLWLTVQITFTAVVFGIVWGTALALMRLSNNKLLNFFAKCYVNLFRSIPLLLVLLWFYLALPQVIKYVFNLPPYAEVRVASAMIAFALFEAAYYSEIIRAGINAVAKGQYHAAYALGMTKTQAMRLIILPQAFRSMVPLLLTQGIILFQDTSLVYVMGLIDLFGASITRIGNTQGGTDKYSMIIFAAASYFVICFTASRLVNYFKKGINR